MNAKELVSETYNAMFSGGVNTRRKNQLQHRLLRWLI